MYELPSQYKFLIRKLVRINKASSVYLEIAREIKGVGDKPVLFENVILKNGEESEFPVLANIASSQHLVAEYFGIYADKMKEFILNALDNPTKPHLIPAKDYYNLEVDLDKLPLLYYYPTDGGYYITSGIVIAEDPEYGLNASYHRLMQISKDKFAIRILPRHLHKYIERGLRRFTICIGNTPEVLIAGALSPELGVSELDIANSMKDINLVDFNGSIGCEAQIVFIAELTGETDHSWTAPMVSNIGGDFRFDFPCNWNIYFSE